MPSSVEPRGVNLLIVIRAWRCHRFQAANSAVETQQTANANKTRLCQRSCGKPRQTLKPLAHKTPHRTHRTPPNTPMLPRLLTQHRPHGFPFVLPIIVWPKAHNLQHCYAALQRPHATHTSSQKQHTRRTTAMKQRSLKTVFKAFSMKLSIQVL